MRFTNGYWLDRENFTVERGSQIYDLNASPAANSITAFAPVRKVRGRGDTLNNPLLTATYTAIADGVIRVTIENHRGVVKRGPYFEVSSEEGYNASVEFDSEKKSATLTAGSLRVHLETGDAWKATFTSGDRRVTSSLPRSIGHVVDRDSSQHYMYEQLSITPGEYIYGMGERFGAFVKNGQSVDIWNEDGGTTSEQAYKNVPFYLSSAGYGVLVETPGGVSFEVASEMTTRVQFSVEGQQLSYLLIDGPTPKDVLRRYTALTGRPPLVPDWSYGLWLSTSFTTDYDEDTVMSFVDGMAKRDIPLSVFHFDCFWMRGFMWSDFVFDPETFTDPEGLIRRLHERGLKVCVWINPYIAQRSALFDEGLKNGYLVTKDNGDVWQTDLWQAGMALVDFTNPKATAWYTEKLEALLEMGVDCFKTDFGERVPVRNIRWHDGSDPEKMHNYYTHLYNKAVFDLLVRVRGEGEAVLFARSATAGGQQFPVHWGGDNDSSLPSMGETLRGGLSLGLSGFAYWSHDIGGFEGSPDPAVFKRWLPFGLLSSHSRLHGSGSYRVPWAFDEESVDVARRFILLKQKLVPYLKQAAKEANTHGTPLMRAMMLEFPEDRNCLTIDTQYMLGSDLLVAPVFDPDGVANVYLPEGKWINAFTGETVTGGGWQTEIHDYTTLPLYVREGVDVGFTPGEI